MVCGSAKGTSRPVIYIVVFIVHSKVIDVIVVGRKRNRIAKERLQNIENRRVHGDCLDDKKCDNEPRNVDMKFKKILVMDLESRECQNSCELRSAQ
jgi:hypothetical protein